MPSCSYLALVQGYAGDFAVSFPDLPGCATSRGRYDDAIASASAALTQHLEKLSQDGAEPPPPSSEDAFRQQGHPGCDPVRLDCHWIEIQVEAPDVGRPRLRVRQTPDRSTVDAIYAAAGWWLRPLARDTA